MSVVNIAAYRFVALEDLPRLQAQLLAAAEQAQLKGTVLIAPEGINLFLAGSEAGIAAFVAVLEADVRLAGLTLKRSLSATQPFKKLLVKVKREIITLRQPQVNPALTPAPSVSPQTLKAWLDQGHDDAGLVVQSLERGLELVDRRPADVLLLLHLDGTAVQQEAVDALLWRDADGVAEQDVERPLLELVRLEGLEGFDAHGHAEHVRFRAELAEPLRRHLDGQRAHVDTDPAAPQLLRDRDGRAPAHHRVEHEVLLVRRRLDDAPQQGLGLLGRMGLLAVLALDPLFAGAQCQGPVGPHLGVFVEGLQGVVVEGVALLLARALNRHIHQGSEGDEEAY